MRTQSFILLSMVVLLAMSTSAGAYSGGTGEPNDPYLIATVEDMNAIGANPDDWDKHFLLVADINLADYTGTQFNIIGNDNNAFTGVFDGNDHTISNFTYQCTDTGYIGLFGYVNDPNAEIKNLTLINPNVNTTGHSSHRVGCLVGWLENGTISLCSAEGASVSGNRLVGGLLGSNWGTMTNCYSTGNVTGTGSTPYEGGTGGLVGSNRGIIISCYSSSSILGTFGAGGLVGHHGGTISNSYATGIVSGEVWHTGGLVGYNSGTISNSYATGAVDGNEYSGGLVGWNYKGSISNCYAKGAVAGIDYTGGLVGYNKYDGTISNCYATGSVTGTDFVGGLVGQNGYGNYSSGYIYNCYSTGEVTGSSDIGGLVGLHIVGEIEASFWDIETGGPDNGIGTPLSTIEMQTESTFTDAGWDFIEIWNIGENQTYPFLRVYPAGDINHDDIVNFYDLAILADHWLEKK